WSLSLAMVLAAVGVLRADEPQCKCQAETTVHQTAVPMLSQLPFVKRLFTIAPPICQGACPAEAADHLIVTPDGYEEVANRLGFFFGAADGLRAPVVIFRKFDVHQCAGEECAAACASSEAKKCAGEACELEVKVAGTSKCCGDSCTCETTAGHLA